MMASAVESDAAAGANSIASQALCRQNIRMMFAFQALSALAYSAALGPVFDRYIFYLGGGAARGPILVNRSARNSLVGMTESISGLSSLVLALPVGLLVDANPEKRARLLKYAGVFGAASVACMIVACLTDFLAILYLALILLGIFSELSSSVSEAIFADSIPAGQRSGLFTTKAVIATVGGACGPLLSACGLLVIGDKWEPYQMKAVIVSGSLLFPISCVALSFFQDPPAMTAGAESSEVGASAVDAEPEPATRGKMLGPLGPRSVPVLLGLADFLTCIGAGMTVKFFNLFFIEDRHFSPTQICWLQTAYPLVIAVFMKFTERLAKPLGRAQASLLFFSSNVLCLFLLSQVESLPILLTIFLLRGGFANSTYPIDRSILMDFTPSSQRGRWNAVESLTSMTWSGSAFIGGLLSDAHDYRYTFLITALVYATACVIYSPLLRIVPRREAAAAVASVGAVSEITGAREVPLMSATS